MIRVRQVKVFYKETDKLKDKIAFKLKINVDEIIDFSIIKESIDSRHKTDIYLVYEVDVNVKDVSKIKVDNDIFISPKEIYEYTPKGSIKSKRPVVVGAGPAGLFAAYMLSEYGYNPILIERGSKVEDRVSDVEEFLNTGLLNTESNVQFGEGGAGTFSDGKLNTATKDTGYRFKKVFETFVECGAPYDILYKAKPHIGTDKLRNVIINLRNKIISNGGEVRYHSKLEDIVIENNKLTKIKVNSEFIDTDILVLAVGHSARDTFYMLNNYLNMEAKPFAVGVRIEHKQSMINLSQYGVEDSVLGPASYVSY